MKIRSSNVLFSVIQIRTSVKKFSVYIIQIQNTRREHSKFATGLDSV